MSKKYKWYDLCSDEAKYKIRTLDEMKKWLVAFWEEGPDENMTDEEHVAWIDEIRDANESELHEWMGNAGYSFCDIEEDLSLNTILKVGQNIHLQSN